MAHGWGMDRVRVNLRISVGLELVKGLSFFLKFKLRNFKLKESHDYLPSVNYQPSIFCLLARLRERLFANLFVHIGSLLNIQ